MHAQPLSRRQRLDLGMQAAESPIVRQDKIWARYSGDKVDVAHGLADTIRTLFRTLDPDRPLRALSLGSSSEPQFRILESMFRGGLWLLDTEPQAIDIIQERNQRQGISHVHPIRADFLDILRDGASGQSFLSSRLHGRKMDLVTLHHSLYYAPRQTWLPLLCAIYSTLLRPFGAIHAVLMSSQSTDTASANWLYNHFAGRFFGITNDQDLPNFASDLRADPAFQSARIETRSSPARFWCDDFSQLMHGVWMILLHPHVHCFNEAQQREVIEHVYARIYAPGIPISQVQDHLFIHASPATSAHHQSQSATAAA